MTDWRKSSYSQGGGTDCVELATLEGPVRGIRDSKHPEGPHLSITRSALAALIQGVKEH